MDADALRPYRSKKRRPCDACRRRRIGCVVDVAHQSCSLCRSRNTQCSFLLPASRKSRRYEGSTPADSNVDPFSEPPNAIADSSKSLTLNSAPRQDGAAQAQGTDGRDTRLFVGLSGDQNPEIYRHLSFNQSNSFSHDRLRWACQRLSEDIRDPVYFTVVPDEHLGTGTGTTLDPYNLDQINRLVNPFQQKLLDIFLRVVHPSYPIIDQEALSGSRDVRASLLAAIYAMGIKHWSYTESSSDDCPQLAPLNGTLEHLIREESKNPSLDTVQASLLYLQIPPTIVRAPNDPGHWSMTANLVAIAQDLGLHRDPKDWAIPTEQIKLRKRLWWAVYIQSTWQALGLGRPLLIKDDDEDWDVSIITPDDFSNDRLHDTQPGISAFTQMASLTRILCKVLQNCFSLRAAKDPTSYLPTIGGLSEELREWRRGARFDIGKRCFSNPSGTLVLSYFVLEIMICRAYLRGTDDYGPQITQLRSEARELASAVVRFTQDLTVDQMQSFWWCYSRINFAIAGSFMLGLLLVSTDDQEYHELKSLVDNYRLYLRTQSKAFVTPSLAAIRMDLALGKFSDNFGSRNNEVALEQLKEYDLADLMDTSFWSELFE